MEKAVECSETEDPLNVRLQSAGCYTYFRHWTVSAYRCALLTLTRRKTGKHLTPEDGEVGGQKADGGSDGSKGSRLTPAPWCLEATTDGQLKEK